MLLRLANVESFVDSHFDASSKRTVTQAGQLNAGTQCMILTKRELGGSSQYLMNLHYKIKSNFGNAGVRSR